MVKLQPKKRVVSMRNKSEARPQISIFSTGLRNLNQRFSMDFSEIHSIPTTWSIPWDIQLIITYDSSLTKINKLNRSVRSSVGGFSLWGLSKSQRPFSAGNVTILFETHWWWCWQSHSHGLTVHSPDQWEWSTTLITKKQPHTDTQAWIW